MTIPPTTMTLLAEILDERMRQIGMGFTLEHDDCHQKGELAQAAAALCLKAIVRQEDELRLSVPPGFPGSAAVPWPEKAVDPETPNYPVRQGLIVAIAMLLAEVERLDRLRDAGEIEYCGGCGALVWWDETVVDVEGEVLCPACAHGRKIAYAHEPNFVARFLRERCESTPEASEKAAVLYAAFQTWCVGAAHFNPRYQITQRVFRKILESRHRTLTVYAPSGTYYVGLRLRREV